MSTSLNAPIRRVQTPMGYKKLKIAEKPRLQKNLKNANLDATNYCKPL